LREKSDTSVNAMLKDTPPHLEATTSRCYVTHPTLHDV
jgi:hypothetical protein